MKRPEAEHPFYKPLGRRIAIVAALAAWSALELYHGAPPLWIALSCGSLAYAVWAFLITFPKDSDPPSSP